VREKAAGKGGAAPQQNYELCDFFEGHVRADKEALLPPGASAA
jgi:hypothetical protein